MRVALNGGLSALLTIAAAGAMTAGAVVGCDSGDTSDRRANQSFKTAILERHIGGEKGDDAARKALEPVASNPDLSQVNRAHGNAMLAQLDADTAVELMRKIDREEMDLSRVAFELNQLAVQLDVGALLVSDYSKYDPKTVLDHIQQQIIAAQGGPDQPTWDHEGVQLPTLEGVKSSIAKLEGDLSKLQDQVKGLTEQRAAVQTEATAAQESADASKGDKSVEEFKRASALRHKAADLFTQIDQVNATMQPLERQLSIAQGQQQVATDFINQMQAQSEALKAGWQATQEKINSQVTLAKEIVQGHPDAPKDASNSLAQKAAEIKRMADEIKDMRGAAQERLDSAIKRFNDAKKAADDLRLTLKKKIDDAANETRPERDAWKKLMDVMDAQYYSLRESSAQRMLASLYASQAASLLNRVNLQASVVPIIERAGAEVPADLRPGGLDKDFKQAVTLADEAYKAADDILANMLEGTAPKDVKDAAKVERILVQYGWAQVAKLNGENKVADDRLKQAIADRDGAVQEGIRLPALPAELGTPPSPATQPADEAAAPTTEPATEATTAPSEESPATEPAPGEAAPAEPGPTAPSAPAPAEPAPGPGPGRTPPA